jgi:hypothetical protein
MAILAMRGHGQDARATSELTLKGAAEAGLEKVIQAPTGFGLPGFGGTNGDPAFPVFLPFSE